MQINLAAQEIQMLGEVLTDYLSDLRTEIANADNMDFREALKHKERFLKGLLERLDAADATG